MLEKLGKCLDRVGYFVYSTNRHGIHSPFVYNFADLVLYNNGDSIVESIEYQRTLMIQSKGKIQKLSISYFVDNYTLSSKYCRLLNRILIHYSVSNIREFGWCSGIETNYILNSFLQDNRPLSYQYYNSEVNRVKEQCNKDYWDNHELSNLEIKNHVLNTPTLYLFHWSIFDEKEFWVQFDKIEPFLNNDDIIVVNGLRNTSKHQINFLRMKNIPKLTVSIDLFDMGIFFLRQEQPKQEFILRF